jgi:hypothetical protein
MMFRQGAPAYRADLVAYADAVELELYSEGRLRRQLRFLRDAGARAYAERICEALGRRGFIDRRSPSRPDSWLAS